MCIRDRFTDPAPATVALGYRPARTVADPPARTSTLETVHGAAQYVLLEPPDGVYGLYWPASGRTGRGRDE